jgi:hypothetical protein
MNRTVEGGGGFERGVTAMEFGQLFSFSSSAQETKRYPLNPGTVRKSSAGERISTDTRGNAGELALQSTSNKGGVQDVTVPTAEEELRLGAAAQKRRQG